MRYVTLVMFVSVWLSKNLTERFALFVSSNVKSFGDKIELNATDIPSKSIGGASDPLWCWAHAGEIETINNATTTSKLSFRINTIVDTACILKYNWR